MNREKEAWRYERADYSVHGIVRKVYRIFTRDNRTVAITFGDTPEDLAWAERICASLPAPSPAPQGTEAAKADVNRELLEACKAAAHSLHGVLAVAYLMESEKLKDVGVRPDALRCKECGYLSPVNQDGSTFNLNHAEGCRTLEAIRAEQALVSAIAKSEAL